MRSVAAFVWAAVMMVLVDGAAHAAEMNAQICLVCHDAQTWPGVHQIGQTPHDIAVTGERKFGGPPASCDACHGESAEHARRPTEVAPEFTFSPDRRGSVAAESKVCRACHEVGPLAHWSGSTHETEEVGCAGCHKVCHQVPLAIDRSEQAGLCYTCHRDVRARVNLPSRHRIRETEMICSDCHNPHGTMTAADLTATSLNESCFECHSELRGPYLFDHPPATEDCSLCHTPHGSVHQPLLRSRGPFLCQQCHMSAFHPSTLASGQGLPGRSRDRNLLSRNCMNCHPSIHGSNHPSGARLTR